MESTQLYTTELFGELQRRLNRVHQNGDGRSFKACCPCHDDRTPSLSVTKKGDKVLVKCFSPACRAQLPEVCAALGIDRGRRQDRPSRSRVEDFFSYRTADGSYLFDNVRFAGGSKATLGVWNDERGNWDWGIKQIQRPLPLYRLPELLASDPKSRVWVTEGEKHADELAEEFGLIAVTTAMGAGNAKSSDLSTLHGRHVVLLPDNDDPGRSHMRAIAQAINGKAKSVRILELPDLPVKGDVIDWMDAGGTRDELIALAKAAPQYEPSEGDGELLSSIQPVSVCAADVEPEAITWLWPDRFALGKLALIGGDPDQGKSLITIDIAARVSKGRRWPDDRGRAPRGSVIMLSAEDDPADTLRPRLDAAKADVARVYFLKAVRELGVDGERHFNLQRDLAALRQMIDRLADCRLVVIDPLAAYCGRTDSYRDDEMRVLLAPMAALAVDCDIALIVVKHLRKGSGSFIQRLMGSIGTVAACRSAWGIGRNPEDSDTQAMLFGKGNLIPADRRTGLAYTIAPGANDAPRIIWEKGDLDITADEAFASSSVGDRDDSPREEAKDFLRKMLAAGPVPARKVITEANAIGISLATLKRAKAAEDKGGIGVQSDRTGFDGVWVWSLPEPEGSQKHRRVSRKKVRPLGESEPLRESKSTKKDKRTRVRL